jgi:hypothetical protein
MRSSTFPPIRVQPETRALVESVLREGESLTQFIEKTVVDEANWRRVQMEFNARGDAALERHFREGGGMTADQFLEWTRERAKVARKRLEDEVRKRSMR